MASYWAPKHSAEHTGGAHYKLSKLKGKGIDALRVDWARMKVLFPPRDGLALFSPEISVTMT